VRLSTLSRLVTGLGLLALVACGDDDTTSGGTAGTGAGTTGYQVDPAPGGVRRLTPSQLRYSMEYLLGAEAALLVPEPDNTPQLRGFESIAAAELSYSSSEVDGWESAATRIADAALDDLSGLARFAPCVNSAPTAACYEDVAARFGRVAWRRSLDDAEKARLVAIANAAQAWGEGDFDTGLRYELMAILQSPNFLYQVEVGEPHPTRELVRVLTQQELASRMSLFLLHRTPDLELLDAADRGELESDEQIRAAARAMLTQPEARRALDRFYGELFAIDSLGNVNRTAALFPEWGAELARSMQEETLRFIGDIVFDRDADARELFTSQSTFVDARLADFYGVVAPSAGWSEVTLPESQGRLGILGKPAFLARYAQPSFTSPTRRGRFVWEKFLCDQIPDPPPGVDITVPPEEEGKPQTMREKLEIHMEEPSCASCHQKVDPIGLAMEHFDAIGKYRADDRGLPLDTAGEYSDFGSFAGAADLGLILAEDERATTCFVKNFVRGSMGHLETRGEKEEIEALAERFAADGYSLRGLMVELVTSPAFRTVGELK